MDLDPLLLSRLQFVWVIAWHILLPALTVGLASYIAVLEGMHFATGREVYLRASTFWGKDIFRFVRDGCRVGHCHALSVRHELEPLFRRHSEHHIAATRL